ncbi:hypothetical protein L9F63_026555, partial [Diploptera punctata]
TNFEATPPPILIDNGPSSSGERENRKTYYEECSRWSQSLCTDKEVATLIENLYS